MAAVKNGSKMVCVPCGREVLISSCGVSRTTLWCCGRPMKGKVAVRKNKSKKKKK